MRSVAVVGLAVMILAAMPVPAAEAPNPPADRVVVMYFHRTQRCPTCLKMGGYSEEAVIQGFSRQVALGTVEFHYVDFQNAKNAALTQAYQIHSPALVVVKVRENRAIEYRNLTEIWTKVREKPEFLRYVRQHVAAYLP